MARLVGRRVGAFPGGGRSTSADTRKRARSRCTIVMLSSFFPLRTSLTRLGVPRIGAISARVTAWARSSKNWKTSPDKMRFVKARGNVGQGQAKLGLFDQYRLGLLRHSLISPGGRGA